MGMVCDTGKNKETIKYDNTPLIFHQQLNNIPNNYSYKYNFSKIKNNFNNKTFNLKFIFYNFKIKYCISHKSDRNSIYITEISIGKQTFPLKINCGHSPNIPDLEDINHGYVFQKDFTFDELEKLYLSIDIYEYTDNYSSSLSLNMAMPNDLKSKAKYNSYFRINLASFLFKSSNCDFPLMGTNQLSSKSRITFNCIIEYREKIKIEAAPLKNGYIQRLIFEYNDKVITCQTKNANNYFSMITPPLTMEELQKSNIFLETIENETYTYIDLNELKSNIIINAGDKLLTAYPINEIEYHSPIDMNIPASSINEINGTNDTISPFEYAFNSYGKPLYKEQSQNYNNTIFNSPEYIQNNEAVLIIYNLPYLTQINTLYFTEYGNIYNTSFLHLVNNDQDLHSFRKNKQISSEDFYNKLVRYYTELEKPQYDFSVTNELQILLMRSIDMDKFMFLYPSEQALFQMIILMMKLGIIAINKLLTSNEEFRNITFSKIINTLMKREELDNAALYYFFSNIKGQDRTPILIYNQLYVSLFRLYIYMISNKSSSNNDSALIELFSRLYFKKSYLRQLMLTTFSGQIYNPQPKSRESIIYDDVNDYKLNEFLSDETKNEFKSFAVNGKIPFDKYRLFKRIIITLRENNFYKYPFDYKYFDDNQYILGIIKKDISDQRIEANNINPLTNDCYESLMLFSDSYHSISDINTWLIFSTNGRNQYAVYTLFIYFKSLLEYYHSLTNSKLLFQYTYFEKAAEMLIMDEDSVSLPRLFWFYYCCYNLILTQNLKWFIIRLTNKYFDKLAFHWSFTIRQVYFKFLIYVLYDRLKEKEGRFFNKQKIEPFLNKSLNINEKTNPYIFQSNNSKQK